MKLRPRYPVREAYSQTELLLDLTFLLACCRCHYSLTEYPGHVQLAVHFSAWDDVGAEIRTFASCVEIGLRTVDQARIDVHDQVRRYLQASPRWDKRNRELQSIGFPPPPEGQM